MQRVWEGCMQEILLRVVLGGTVVSVFAALGDIVKPKSFAGLFGAAPSVALATLALTVKQNGTAFATIEGRSMILGALAFFAYAQLVSHLMIQKKWAALPSTGLALLVWLGAAFGLFYCLTEFTS